MHLCSTWRRIQNPVSETSSFKYRTGWSIMSRNVTIINHIISHHQKETLTMSNKTTLSKDLHSARRERSSTPFHTEVSSDFQIWWVWHTTLLNYKPLWSSGQSSWLQIQRSGFNSQCYQIFWIVVGLEQGPLSLVNTTEELLGRKSSDSGL
jgi:hypothetical protein